MPRKKPAKVDPRDEVLDSQLPGEYTPHDRAFAVSGPTETVSGIGYLTYTKPDGTEFVAAAANREAYERKGYTVGDETEIPDIVAHVRELASQEPVTPNQPDLVQESPKEITNVPEQDLQAPGAIPSAPLVDADREIGEPISPVPGTAARPGEEPEPPVAVNAEHGSEDPVGERASDITLNPDPLADPNSEPYTSPPAEGS